MANTTLFKTILGKLLPSTNTFNNAGAPAYRLEPKQALAQYAMTGCLNQTFYSTAEQQLQVVLDLCLEVEPAFVAKTAIYCREAGYMKDMPALMCAYLATFDRPLFELVFDRVIDNAKMLRTFMQILRSGVAGRKSFGSSPRRKIRQWLERQSDDTIFAASVGNDPSLVDILKMVHPKPKTREREALYGYLLGRPHDSSLLPPKVQHYEAYKAGLTKEVPDVPFQMLTALSLDTAAWREIARNAPWHMTRMNLNTFARHGVFGDAVQGKASKRHSSDALVGLIAARLRDPAAIRKAKAFPYQLLAAYQATGEDIPKAIREALHDAMEVAVENVPSVDGRIFVCPDVSGSMSSSATGYRQGATSAVRCVDVAALVAAALVRKNPTAEVLPFEQTVVTNVKITAKDSVMTNAERLAGVGGGGTNCSAPLKELNRRKAQGDLVLFISDNESWVDAEIGRGTALLAEWQIFRARNPQAKLVCLDIQPNRTTQAQSRADILNIGGFSDQVFSVIADFASNKLGSDHWVGVIEGINLEPEAQVQVLM